MIKKILKEDFSEREINFVIDGFNKFGVNFFKNLYDYGYEREEIYQLFEFYLKSLENTMEIPYLRYFKGYPKDLYTNFLKNLLSKEFNVNTNNIEIYHNSFKVFNNDNNIIYSEGGFDELYEYYEYDDKGRKIYGEYLQRGYNKPNQIKWWKKEYDKWGREIYRELSDKGVIFDYRKNKPYNWI